MSKAGGCFTGPKRKEKQNRESRFNRNRKLLDPVGISWVHSLLLGHRVILKWKWGKEKKEVKRRTALKQNDFFFNMLCVKDKVVLPASLVAGPSEEWFCI